MIWPESRELHWFYIRWCNKHFCMVLTKACLSFFVCNSNVSAIRWHCAFNMRYTSYHQIIDFYCQEYPVGHVIMNLDKKDIKNCLK